MSRVFTINEADKHDLVDPEALRIALEAIPGVAGARTPARDTRHLKQVAM
jgi:hypothetical protein